MANEVRQHRRPHSQIRFAVTVDVSQRSHRIAKLQSLLRRFKLLYQPPCRPRDDEHSSPLRIRLTRWQHTWQWHHARHAGSTDREIVNAVTIPIADADYRKSELIFRETVWVSDRPEYTSILA